MSESRNFSLHKNLFFNVVLRQAGSLEKAILEGVMNSVDAKATKCQVEVFADRVVITDNGQGFRSREEIEHCFEVFGQPHDENDHKVYAQFRIGRGQLMAYGVNHWRSGRFGMHIDVKNSGMEYQLEDKLPEMKGCQITIELYAELLPSRLEEVTRTLARWVAYAPIRIKINNTVVTKKVESQKWDQITDDAYIRLSGSGGIDVYNLGMYAMTLPRYQYGTGGVVVSAKQLKVNFARNDVMSDCEVWRRIKPLIDQRMTRDLLRRKSLDDDGRTALIKQIVERKLVLDTAALALKIVTGVNGRHYPLRVLLDPRWPGLSHARRGDLLPCRVHDSKRAFVISQQTLNDFDCTNPKQLQHLLEDRNSTRYDMSRLPVLDMAELIAGMSDTHDPLDEDQLTDRERVWLKLVEAAAPAMQRGSFKTMRYMIGKSDTANGWTDALTYIAINRRYLTRNNFDIVGFTNVGRLILHELCHVEADVEEDSHDMEFYQRFHDNAGLVGKFVDICVRRVPKIFKQLQKRMNKEALRQQDRTQLLKRTDTSIVPVDAE